MDHRGKPITIVSSRGNRWIPSDVKEFKSDQQLCIDRSRVLVHLCAGSKLTRGLTILLEPTYLANQRTCATLQEPRTVREPTVHSGSSSQFLPLSPGLARLKTPLTSITHANTRGREACITPLKSVPADWGTSLLRSSSPNYWNI